MSLALLLDENISQVIVDQLKYHRPTIIAESVHTWRTGNLQGSTDRLLLEAAHSEQLTLVTYDQKTIPAILAEMYSEGIIHSGVIFIDNQTIPSNDFGKLTRALILLWVSLVTKIGKTESVSWKIRITDEIEPTHSF